MSDQDNQFPILVGDSNGRIYQVVEILTAKESGSVYLAFQNFDQSRPVAIKTFDQVKRESEQMQKEVSRLKIFTKYSIPNPNIVGYIDFAKCLDQNHSKMQQFKICLVMQFCQSTLQKQIQYREKNKKSFTFQEIIFLVESMTSAICTIHQEQMFHRDIKPSNLLLAKGHLLVSSFGFAKKIEQSNGSKVGTRYFMAPEISLIKENANKKYNQLCDIWSIGVTATVLLKYQIMNSKRLSKQQLFDAQVKKMLSRLRQIRNEIKTQMRENGFKQKQVQCIYTILQKTLQENPSDRSTAKELLNYLNQSKKMFPERLFKLSYYVSESDKKILNNIKESSERHLSQYLQHVQKLIRMYEKDSSKFLIMLEAFMAIVSLNPQNIFVYDYPCYRGQKKYKEQRKKTSMTEYEKNIDINSKLNLNEKYLNANDTKIVKIVVQIYTVSGLFREIIQNKDDEQFIHQSICQIKNTILGWKYLYKDALESKQPLNAGKNNLKRNYSSNAKDQLRKLQSTSPKLQENIFKLYEQKNYKNTQMFDQQQLFELIPSQADQHKKMLNQLQMIEINRRSLNRQCSKSVKNNWDEAQPTAVKISQEADIYQQDSNRVSKKQDSTTVSTKKVQKDKKLEAKKQELTKLIKCSQLKRQKDNFRWAQSLNQQRNREQIIKSYLKIYLFGK